MKNIILISLISIVCFSCKSPEGSVITYENVNGEKLPHIHFDNILGEPEEIGISEIIDDFEIIPLESTEECLIEYAQNTAFYDDKILVSTQHFPGPAPVYMFSKDGRFIREVGKGGRGPGEHNGYMVMSIRVTDTIQINFMDKIQLFDKDGELLSEVKEPMELMGDSYSYNMDTYFSVGSICGYPTYPRDSVMLVFHKASGKITKRIPRPEYPPQNGNGYTPTGWGESIYRYNGFWNLYMPSLDTLFAIKDMDLVPRLIFDFGELGQDYNRVVEPKKLLGQYIFKLLVENDNYWLFKNAVITEANVREGRSGQWGGQFDMTSELVIINKKTGDSKKIHIYDDVWNLAEKRMIGDWSEISDHNRLVYALQSSDMKVKLAEKLKESDLDPEVRTRLEDLDSRITENSNPVIFVYHLKDKFKL